jgi:hypothetical protein
MPLTTDLLAAMEQIGFLGYEIRLMVGSRWWRWLTCWSTASLWIISSYRVEPGILSVVREATCRL